MIESMERKIVREKFFMNFNVSEKIYPIFDKNG